MNIEVSAQQVSYLILLYLPALVANMAPVIATKRNMIPWLNIPIDLGISIGGNRLLGENKTIRGFVVAILSAALVGIGIYFIFREGPYQTFNSAVRYGALIGCAALVGDSVKSFFKRRRSLASGAMWFPFDQIDFAIGATIVVLMFSDVPVLHILVAIIVIGILSFVVSAIGFALHIKKNL